MTAVAYVLHLFRRRGIANVLEGIEVRATNLGLTLDAAAVVRELARRELSAGTSAKLVEAEVVDLLNRLVLTDAGRVALVLRELDTDPHARFGRAWGILAVPPAGP